MDEFLGAELWAPVPTWEGLYEVSTLGRVRSLDRVCSRGFRRKGKVMKPNFRQGYARVWMRLDGRVEQGSIHVLMLSAFEGARPEGLVARHLNGNKGDNFLWNLLWGTYAENNFDRQRHGRDPHLTKTHCPQGHPYAGDNLVIYDGARNCRECKRVSSRRVKERKKAATLEGSAM